ncbi:MAG: NlpC/P60 family protein [Gammaproteobacteria bacterium]
MLLSLLLCFMNLAYAEQQLLPAITESIPVFELKEYPNSSVSVQQLITIASDLSQKKLTYLYGSSDPKNEGMDCSGTIHFLLNKVTNKDVPRQADEMYTWAEKKGHLYKVTQQDFSSQEFSNLKPGDLLFWSGTYNVKRNPPITHVMIYLGKNSQDKPLMFGASDGRRYKGKKIRGVSVFDFELPNDKSLAKFVGYSCVPELTCDESVVQESKPN